MSASSPDANRAQGLQRLLNGLPSKKELCRKKIAALGVREKKLSQHASAGAQNELEMEEVITKKKACERELMDLGKREIALQEKLKEFQDKDVATSTTSTSMLSLVQPSSAPAPASVAQTPAVDDRVEAERREMIVCGKTLAALDQQVVGLEARLAKGLAGETAEQRAEHQKTSDWVYPKRAKLRTRMDELKKGIADRGDQTSTGGAHAENILPATSPADGDPARAPALSLARLPFQPSPSSQSVPAVAQLPRPDQLAHKRKAKESTGVNGAQKPEASSKRRLPNDSSTEGTTPSAPIPMEVDEPSVSIPTAPLRSSRAAVPAAALRPSRAAVPTAPVRSFQKPAASSHRQPVLKSFWAQAPPAARLPPAQPLPTGPSSAVDIDTDVVRPLFKVEGLTEEEVADELGEAEAASSKTNGEEDDEEAAAVDPVAQGRRQTTVAAKRAAVIRAQEAVLDRLDEEARKKIRGRIAAAAVIEASGESTADKTLALLNVSLESNGCPQFLSTDPAFLYRIRTPALAEHLHDRALHPFVLDVEKLVADGVFTKVDIDIDAKRGSNKIAQYYFRWIEFEDAEKFRACLAAYGQMYADSTLIATVTTKLDAEIAAGVLREDDPCGIGYDGTCIDATPAGRVLQDHDAKWSRVTNFLKVARACTPPPTYSSYEYVDLQLPVLGTSDLLTNRLVGDIERVAIAATKDLSLNSANGGLRPYVAAPLEDIKLVKDAEATLADVNARLPLDLGNEPALVAMRERLRKHLPDSYQYFESQDHENVGTMVPRDEEGGGVAYDAIDGDLRAVSSRRGHVLDFLVSNDTTLADIRGDTQFSGVTAAKGPSLHWLLDALLLGLDPDAALGSRLVAARANLWVWGPVHVLILEAIAFLSRSINIVDPHLLRVQSAKLGYMFELGLFRDAFKKNLSDSLTSFFACGTVTTSDLLDEILDKTLVIVGRDTPRKGWLPQAGRLSVGHSGPFDTDVRLILALVDTGFNLHDPGLQEFLIPLESIVAVIGAISRKLIAVAIDTSGGPPVEGRESILSWYRDLRARIGDACRERRVTAELEERRALLVEVVNAIGGARTRAALGRDMAKKRKAGMTEEEVKAERSKVMSDRRLGSVGGPRFEGEPDLSPDVDRFFTRPQLAAVRPASLVVPVLDPTRVIGKPNISTRLNQLALLVRDHNEAALDGNDSPAPHIRDMEVGDEKYVRWFLSRPKGAEMRRSAPQIGRVQPERNAEQQAAWTESYRKRQLLCEERKRRDAGKSNAGELGLIQTLVDLAKDGYTASTGLKSRQNVATIECEACGDRFVANLQKVVHFCYAAGPERVERKGTDPMIVRHRALYPAALVHFLAIEGAELEEVLADAHLTSVAALSVLPPKLRDCFPSESDAIIYVHANTPLRLKRHMAVDALIMAFTPKINSDWASERGDDWWWGTGAKGWKAVLEHVGGGGGGAMRQARCLGCHVHQVVPAPSDNFRQHSCSEKNGAKTSVHFGKNGVRDIRKTLQMPCFLLRRLAYAFTVDKDSLRESEKTKHVTLLQLFRWKA